MNKSVLRLDGKARLDRWTASKVGVGSQSALVLVGAFSSWSEWEEGFIWRIIEFDRIKGVVCGRMHIALCNLLNV